MDIQFDLRNHFIQDDLSNKRKRHIKDTGFLLYQKLKEYFLEAFNEEFGFHEEKYSIIFDLSGSDFENKSDNWLKEINSLMVGFNAQYRIHYAESDVRFIFEIHNS